VRSERVFTNLTCNQACSFCTARRPAEDRSFIERRAVERRIAEARARGAAQIVLTGGEPTLRRDLTDLVRQTRATGAEVVLETNATLIGEEQARALREAGLEIARVHLSGWGHGLDAVTRDEGGFAAATAGLRALLGAGLRVEVSAAIVRSTAPLIAALPAALAGISVDGQSIRGLWLVIPTASPAPGELLSYQEAAGVAAEAAAQARAHGLWVQLSPDSPMPPCVYPPKERPAHLFALTAGGGDRPGFRRAEACGRCAVRDRCPGLPGDYLDRWPAGDLYPISDDRGRRRLSLISSVEQQIARELVSPNLGWNADGTSYQEQIVRVVFQCNQSCRFCFVSTHLPAAPDAAIREAILDTTRRGLKVVLSGGEPTLSPRLIEYVRLAREHSALPIQLQTNAGSCGR
jgi:molybdenum cofactor biosynthesis enzyme MoaA